MTTTSGDESRKDPSSLISKMESLSDFSCLEIVHTNGDMKMCNNFSAFSPCNHIFVGFIVKGESTESFCNVCDNARGCTLQLG